MSGLHYDIDWSKNNDISDIKQALAEQLEYLDKNCADHAIREVLQARSDCFDSLLTALWQYYGFKDTGLSLNAIGGYGRRTLHPYSDVDICVLHKAPLSPQLEEKLSAFITTLWDFNITLGHGVLSIDQAMTLCAEDVTAATSMLDMRRLAGEPEHGQTISATLLGGDIHTSEAFFKLKQEEQTRRHNKSSGSGFSLEPNLKTSPGGLRDIQTLGWIANKHFGSHNEQSLRTMGFFTADEFAELMEAQHFIWRVRWALHMAVRRSENRLLIDNQSEVARRMGFGGENNTAIEKMMRQLYRALSRVRELNRMLMAHFEHNVLASDKTSSPLVINEHFEIDNGLIRARDEGVFIERKQILIMFRLIAEHEDKIKSIAPETLRLLRQVRRRLLGDLQDFHACRQEFIALFRQPRGMGLAITLMHQYGLLAAYLPQWREIVGQMQFDLFHAYTVDEHTHRLLKNLYQFEVGKEDKSICLVGTIYRGLDTKDTLLFAALYHDLAKGRGGDHSKLGAVDAAHFASFHGLKASQAKTISWLVENHLLMSMTAQRMDIYDPDVVSNFAKAVKTESRLEMLYCLTVADIQATNSNLWNDWRATLLADLFQACRRALRSGLENMLEMRSLIRERKADAKDMLLATVPNLDEDNLKQLWKQMPLSFFSNADADDICRYTQAIIRYHNEARETPLILLNGKVYKGCSDLFVYTKDKPGLFVSLFNTLNSLRC
ncbi:MAG: [protein-PII] uridylyltransferase [Shewanella sp.]|nr:[protein-PII] uridylyltransferase [Shewanella sp.]